jgi:hypothetical protein
MKVRLKLRKGQLSYYHQKNPQQKARYMEALEVDHIARARQEYRQAKESDPSTTNFFDDWFRAWNKTHPHPLKPKKEKFINNHLMDMKWEDD